VKTFSRRLKQDSCQTHEHRTHCLTPYSRQRQTQPEPTSGAKIVLFGFFDTRVANVKRNLHLFPHRSIGATNSQAWRTLTVILEVDFFHKSAWYVG